MLAGHTKIKSNSDIIMETKEKYVRMNLATWKELKHFFPAKRGESCADYFQRVLDDIIIKTELMK